MKKLKTVILACLSGISTLSGDGYDVCLQEAMTQTAMTQCTQKAWEAAVKELDQLLESIREAHQGENIFLSRLHEAQRAWRTSCERDLAMKFPLGREAYGSLYTLYIFDEKTQQIQQRILYLKPFKNKKEELKGGFVSSHRLKHTPNQKAKEQR